MTGHRSLRAGSPCSSVASVPHAPPRSPLPLHNSTLPPGPEARASPPGAQHRDGHAHLAEARTGKGSRPSGSSLLIAGTVGRREPVRLPRSRSGSPSRNAGARPLHATFASPCTRRPSRQPLQGRASLQQRPSPASLPRRPPLIQWCDWPLWVERCRGATRSVKQQLAQPSAWSSPRSEFLELAAARAPYPSTSPPNSAALRLVRRAPPGEPSPFELCRAQRQLFFQAAGLISRNRRDSPRLRATVPLRLPVIRRTERGVARRARPPCVPCSYRAITRAASLSGETASASASSGADLSTHLGDWPEGTCSAPAHAGAVFCARGSRPWRTRPVAPLALRPGRETSSRPV